MELATLGQINLIIGKNNTGKSSVLEAIALLISHADPLVLSQILSERGEYIADTFVNNSTETNTKLLASLFSDREVSFQESKYITISANNALGNVKTVSLGFAKYISDSLNDADGVVHTRRKKIQSTENEDTGLSDVQLGFEIKVLGNMFLIPLEGERLLTRFPHRRSANESKMQYISTRNIDKDTNGKLFDNITLTDKEVYVIDALKIIEPQIERLAFVEDASSRSRKAVVKLQGKSSIYPLKSMGDGINHILTIILAVVNCADGYVLIDEFENGLHYSVQNSLWNILFFLAEKLNIQIFATTHSEDCISGFENALNKDIKCTIQGKLIRLDYENEQLKEVIFDAEELKLANSLHIETR